jgi:hypothetical protein
MKQKQSIIVGVLLIVFGIWALLSALDVRWARMDQIWPLVLMAGGAVALYGALAEQPRKPDGVWFGVAALLSGGLLLYITVGPGQWRDLARLWPAFPLIGGVAWVIAWLVDLREVSNLVTGIIASVIGGLGFAYTYGLLDAERGQSIARYWPLVLVLIGLGLIAQFLVQRRR